MVELFSLPSKIDFLRACHGKHFSMKKLRYRIALQPMNLAVIECNHIPTAQHPHQDSHVIFLHNGQGVDIFNGKFLGHSI
jgi:hypothetical protein